MATAKQVKFSTEVYVTLERLNKKREDWQDGLYARSNQSLYEIIGDCLKLYGELVHGEGVRARKEALAEYIKAKDYRFKGSTGLEAKIIRCVFGDKDRRRLQTYTAVLRVAIREKWNPEEVPSRLTDIGGVQEVSLHKASGLTTAQKTEKAKDAFLTRSIAKVVSREIDSHVGATMTGEPLVAVMTRDDDGSFVVHFVIKNTAAVKAALIAQLNANKDAVARRDAEAAKKKASTSYKLSKTEALNAIARKGTANTTPSKHRELAEA